MQLVVERWRLEGKEVLDDAYLDYERVLMELPTDTLVAQYRCGANHIHLCVMACHNERLLLEESELPVLLQGHGIPVTKQ